MLKSCTFHIVFSCSPWAVGAARPGLQLEHFKPPRRGRWTPGLTSVPDAEPWTPGLTSVPEEGTWSPRQSEDSTPWSTGRRPAARSRSPDVGRRGGKSSPELEQIRDKLRATCTNLFGEGGLRYHGYPVSMIIDALDIEMNRSVKEAIPVLTEASKCRGFFKQDELNGEELTPRSDLQRLREYVADRPLSLVLNMYPHQAVPMLEELLSDDSGNIRSRAANATVQAASGIGKGAFGKLIGRILTDRECNIREIGGLAVAATLQMFGKDFFTGYFYSGMSNQCDRVRVQLAESAFDAILDKFGAEDAGRFSN